MEWGNLYGHMKTAADKLGTVIFRRLFHEWKVQGSNSGFGGEVLLSHDDLEDK